MVQFYSEIELLLTNHEIYLPNLPERLKCTICHEILKNAKQSQCGCKFCEKCLINYLDNHSKQCPSKQIDCENSILNIENIYKDNATNKEISQLKGKCPFKGCLFTDSLITITQHIKQCQYQEIECVDCGEKVIKKDFPDHEINNCEMRIVKCQLCDKDLKYKFLMETHLNMYNDDICYNYYDVCPNKCEINEKVNIKDHLRVCSNKIDHCPFYLIKCTEEKMTRKDLLEHNEQEHLSHMKMIIDRTLHLEKLITDLTSKLEFANQVIEDQNNIIKTTNTTILEMKISNENCKTRNFPLINNNLENDVVCINSSFIWKIENFRRHKMEAENGTKLFVTSNSFYIQEFGYRLCLKIYPNGDGIGKGTHLSVFFVIRKGKYDDLLVWPFQQKITLSILEQNGGSNHFVVILTPDSKSNCYKKPIEEYNVGSGSPKFINQFELVRENSIYCRNDTIFIKIMAK